jgi:predicted Zn-dependent protease
MKIVINFHLFRRVICVIALLLLSAGCLRQNKALGEREFSLFTTGQERSIGQQTSEEVEKEYKLSANAAYFQKVQEIGTQLSNKAPRTSELEGYKFKVLGATMVNAFAAPGGYIYVTEGLMNLKPSDDELAFVLGHEIAHVEARHSMKQLQRQLGFNVLTQALSLSEKTKGLGQVSGIGGGLLSLSYSRDQELQADELGIELANAVGYAPQGMLGFFDRMMELEKKAGGSATPSWLRTHPLTESRIEAAKVHIRQLESGKRKNRFL